MARINSSGSSRATFPSSSRHDSCIFCTGIYQICAFAISLTSFFFTRLLGRSFSMPSNNQKSLFPIGSSEFSFPCPDQGYGSHMSLGYGSHMSLKIYIYDMSVIQLKESPNWMQRKFPDLNQINNNQSKKTKRVGDYTLWFMNNPTISSIPRRKPQNFLSSKLKQN